MASETTTTTPTPEGGQVEVMTLKPGWKTTEFWFTVVGHIAGLLAASGVIEAGSTWDRVLGLGLMALSQFGYTVSRGMAKSG